MADISTHRDVIYRGYRRHVGGSVIAITDLSGEPLGVVRHLQRHSPTGMSWGYAGSGAADCARSLLLAAVGENAARCLVCAGTALVVWDRDEDRDVPFESGVHDAELAASCLSCDDGLRRFPYQAFKFEFVATWGDEWTMRRSEVLAWLNSRVSGAA